MKQAWQNKIIQRGIVAITLVIVAGFLWIDFVYARGPNPPLDTCIKYETITSGGIFTSIGKKRCVLSLERVDQEARREKGLSYRSSMPAERGMLFVFDNIGRQCIWMKGMKFDLDIVWLNVRGEVVKLEEKVSPTSYPHEFCANDTFYVIEVNDGVIKSAGLNVGSHVTL